MRAVLINPPVLTVDPYQAYTYADVVPYGLYQIATLLQQEGHQVRVLDMMRYLEGGYEELLSPHLKYDSYTCGDNSSCDRKKDVYLYGQNLDWLDEQLDAVAEPEQILVTCCLPFNFRPAFEVIARCRGKFPRTRIRFGGFYPSTFPEHAGAAGADEVFVGRWPQAEKVFPDLELCAVRTKSWLFRLVSGCKYRCSFCLNSASAPRLVCEPEAAAAEVLRLHRQYGIEEFCNWDPNVMLAPEALLQFLEAMAEAPQRPGLRFDMGVAPHLLDKRMAEAFHRAGTVAMTIPFESTDPAMMRRFGKPYGEAESRRALELCQRAGLDTSHFHCTFLVGVRGEDLAQVFRTFFSILDGGGKPTPFPLTPTPGTREYQRHRAWLEGKDLHLLNGHLWPTQPPYLLDTYDQILKVVGCLDARSAEQQARTLPDPVRECFSNELERWRSRSAAAASPAASILAAGNSAWQPRFSIPSWLHALCQECEQLPRCSRLTERREADPRRCHQQSRRVDISKLRHLLQWLAAKQPPGNPDGLLRQQQALLEHLSKPGSEQGASFEPSASWDGREWSLYRFTYSFHDQRAELWQQDRQQLLGWLELLDKRLLPIGNRLVSMLAPPLAHGLLFGMDKGPGDRARTKIYFRLTPAQGQHKARLIRSLSGFSTSEGRLPPAERLFLVGFDFSAAGVSGIKYYFLYEQLAAEQMQRWFRPEDFYPRLGRLLRLEQWREVILVARQPARKRTQPPLVEQVNVHCLLNNIRLPVVISLAQEMGMGIDFTPLKTLFSEFPLYLSSMTLALKNQGAINLYYRLAGSAAAATS